MRNRQFLHLRSKLPGFKELNIFLHAMYCNGAIYLLLKAFTSNSMAISTCVHVLSDKDSFILNTNAAVWTDKLRWEIGLGDMDKFKYYNIF